MTSVNKYHDSFKCYFFYQFYLVLPRSSLFYAWMKLTCKHFSYRIMWGRVYFEMTSATKYHYFFNCYFLLVLSRCSLVQVVPACSRCLQVAPASFRRFQLVPGSSMFQHVHIFCHVNQKLSLFEKMAITWNCRVSSKPLMQVPGSVHSMFITLLYLLRMHVFCRTRQHFSNYTGISSTFLRR